MGLWFYVLEHRQVSTINWATIGPLAKRHPNVVSLLRRADSSPRLDDGWAKAQPAVVLILKRLRKRGQGFKSHPTDWEKPGIKLGGPWFTWHMLTETLFFCLWSCSLAITSTGRIGLFFFVVLCPGTSEGSTGSGSGVKASQKTGHGFMSHLTDWEKPGIEPGNPWFSRHRLKRVLWLSLGSK